MMQSAKNLLLILCFFAVGQVPALAQSNTILQRIPPPPGYERIHVEEGSFAASLRRLELKPEGSNVRDKRGEEILCGEELVAVIDEKPLPVEVSRGTEGAIKLWGAYRWSKGRRDGISFGLDNGQRATWRDWRDGLRPREHEGRMLFMQVGVPDRSQANFLRYLTFVAENASALSLKRDLEIILPENLSPGDILLSTGDTGGQVALVLDACRNAKAEKLFLIAMGGDDNSDLYIPHPFEPLQGEGAWFTYDGACYAVGLGDPTAIRRFKLNP
jgi:hypothetical protein